MASCQHNCKGIFTQYNLAKFSVFILTFLSYAFLHANRKSFSNVKPTLKLVWTPKFHNSTVLMDYPKSTWRSHTLFEDFNSAEDYLGVLDAVFMASYAVGLFISGYMGDRWSPRMVLGIGMSVSAVVIFVFGTVTEWLHFYNIYFYAFIYMLNGLCQSTGWPAAVAIMGNWFGKSRGFYMGIWSSCASVGNIIGDYLTSAVLEYGYEYGFLVPAAMLFSGGGLIIAGIINDPSELGRGGKKEDGYATLNQEDGDADLIDNNNDDDDEPISISIENSDVNGDPNSESVEIKPKPEQSNQQLNFFRILLIPGVIPYSLAYACLKLVNYAFFFWLTVYMTNKFGWSNEFADKVSVWYDVGGIVGGIVTGLISDYMWSRAPAVQLSLLLTIPALFIYRNTPGSPVNTNIGVLAITGFFIGGPANIISSAISADLGSRPLLSGNAGALSTVTGIVDGTGSIGAAIGQAIVPLLSHALGWEAVFVFFMLMIGATFLCILPILIVDILKLVRSRLNRHNEMSQSSDR